MTLVGRTVGHVRVEALLGVGGMGEVYRGFDEVLERAVALKVIRPEHRLTPETKERFLREARVLSRLDHPNICRVHELIEDPAGEILVLEYIDGPTLKQAVARGIPEGEKLRVAEQVAAALAAAHAREVVHRDLKPDNVMLTAAGEVKVLDFGLARVQEGPPAEAEATRPLAPASADASSHGSLVGTLQYMSPEQARGEPAGPASDLYSLGLLLQELFTGAPAYEPTSGMVAMLARVAAAQTRPATGLDPDLGRLVEALKSGPQAARPSAAAVVAALAAVRAKPERRRRRRLHAALAATAALLVLALVWIARLSGSAPFALGAGEAHTLAVLPFALAPGADPRLEELAPGLAAVLTESLEQLPRVRALDPRRVAEALAAWGGAGPETVRRLEATLGVDVAVAVRLVPGAEGLVCDTELRSGERRVRAPHAGSDAAQALERTVAWIAEMLGAPHETLARGGFGDPLTLQLYALARHRFNSRGAAAARSYLETLLDLDPHFHRGRVLYGRVLWDAGEVPRAEEIWRAALRDLTVADPPRLEADLVYELAWLEADRGRFAEAETLLARMRRLAAREPDLEPVVLDISAYVAAARGDSARAIRLYRDLVEVTRRRHDLFYLEVALNNLIDELLNDHQPQAARPLIDEALALAEVTANSRMASHLHLTLAKLALTGGDRSEVERRAREALAVAGPATNAFLAAQVEQVRLEARMGAEGILCCLAEVDGLAATYRGLDDHRRAADLRLLVARRLREHGRPDLARRQLDDIRRGHGGQDLLRELAPDLAEAR